jgi:hypothetical protein
MSDTEGIENLGIKHQYTKKKKSCVHGKNCEYQNEYQHNLEFTHEDKIDSGKVKKAKNNPSAFTSSGQRLGSENDQKEMTDQKVRKPRKNSSNSAAHKERIAVAADARVTTLDITGVTAAGGCGRGTYINMYLRCKYIYTYIYEYMYTSLNIPLYIYVCILTNQ